MTPVERKQPSPIVLVAHPVGTSRSWLVDALTSKGYGVVVSENGRDALCHVQSGTIALVVASAILPEIDGLELLRKIRELELNVAMVVVSGGSPIDHIYLRVARALGANRTFQLPVPTNTFLDGVGEVIRRLRRFAAE